MNRPDYRAMRPSSRLTMVARPAVFMAFLLALSAAPLAAQTDVIRGRVTTSEGLPIADSLRWNYGVVCS